MSETRVGIERLLWTLGKKIPGAGKTDQKDRPIHFEQEVTWLYRTHPWVLGLDDAVWCAGGGNLSFDDMYVRVEAVGGEVRPRVVLVEAKGAGKLDNSEVKKKLKGIVPEKELGAPAGWCSKSTLEEFLKACEQRQREQRRLRDPLSGVDRETAARQDFEAIKGQLLTAARSVAPSTTLNDLLNRQLLLPEVHFVAPEMRAKVVRERAKTMRNPEIHKGVYQTGFIHSIISRVDHGAAVVKVYRLQVSPESPPSRSTSD